MKEIMKGGVTPNLIHNQKHHHKTAMNTSSSVKSFNLFNGFQLGLAVVKSAHQLRVETSGEPRLGFKRGKGHSIIQDFLPPINATPLVIIKLGGVKQRWPVHVHFVAFYFHSVFHLVFWYFVKVFLLQAFWVLSIHIQITIKWDVNVASIRQMKKPPKLKKLDERIMNFDLWTWNLRFFPQFFHFQLIFMVFRERKEDSKKDKVLLGLVQKMKLWKNAIFNQSRRKFQSYQRKEIIVFQESRHHKKPSRHSEKIDIFSKNRLIFWYQFQTFGNLERETWSILMPKLFRSLFNNSVRSEVV